MRHLLSVSVMALLGLAALPSPAAAVDLELARFFGVCDEKSTDIKAAVGEACIIEAIIGSFSEADNGITVTELPADWDSYYDQIKTRMVGGNPPDVFVMHKHALPAFASIGALAEITPEDYAAAGIDLSDFSDRAIEAVSLGGKHYGVPLDFHAYLWHINLDLLAEAGLVDDAGAPILPTSPEELIAHAKKVEEATGKPYLTGFFAGGPQNMRMFVALMAQQGVDPYNEDQVNLDTDAARNALLTYHDLGEAGGANLELPDDAIRNQFFTGEAAVLIDGTWRVNANDASTANADIALKHYYVSTPAQLFAQPAAWADTHMWAIPASLKRDDPEKFAAAMKLLAWINDHDVDWARTGHVPVRKSVLASEEFKNLPHRSEYAGIADIAYYMKPAMKYDAIQDAIGRELVEYYQNGKPIDDVLADMQYEVEDALQ